jgi:hypothetical protein
MLTDEPLQEVPVTTVLKTGAMDVVLSPETIIC